MTVSVLVPLIGHDVAVEFFALVVVAVLGWIYVVGGALGIFRSKDDEPPLTDEELAYQRAAGDVEDRELAELEAELNRRAERSDRPRSG